MIIYKNVRSLVRDQQQGYLHKGSWMNPPKIEFAMLLITYAIMDAEGLELKITTWWTGRNPGITLRSWLKRRPDVDPAKVEHKVMTHYKRPSRFEPIGERVEVEDASLAACG